MKLRTSSQASKSKPRVSATGERDLPSARPARTRWFRRHAETLFDKVINGQDARWPHRQDACTTNYSWPDFYSDKEVAMAIRSVLSSALPEFPESLDRAADLRP